MSSDLQPRRKFAQFSGEVPQSILRSILADSAVGQVLPAIRQLPLPDWWLAGGAIRNTIWKSIYGADCQLAIKDFDVAFYDAKGDREQERTAKEALENQFPGSIFDVKNQASFATWRAGRRTYASSLDGIADWQHTATAVGVKLDQNGHWWFIAPFGFDDLLNGVVRLGPAHFDSTSAIEKGATYLLKCPALTTASGFVPCLTNPFVSG
jgi:uncharacterized protein